MQIRTGWLLLLLLQAMPAQGQAPPGADSSGAIPPAAWTPAPGPWQTVARATVHAADRKTWQIVVAEREIGTIPGGRSELRVSLPRAAVRRIRGRDTTTVAVLLPTGNRDLEVFPAKSPAQDSVPSRMGADDLGRWPNVCRISILDASGSLDLDHDGFPEVALRRFCGCPASACSGIVLVELNSAGPEILDPASLVPDVRLGRVVLERILPGTDPASPTLQVAPEMLEECRLVAILGIRGNNECPDCCRFPVFLRPGKSGAYEPFYDSNAQSGWLKRTKDDIAAVAAGDAGHPLLSLEEAEVARAAAFFYLTGSGTQARTVISDGLGIRARDFRVQDLLRRIERMFLTKPDGAR
jgi:hypothetical protein